MTYKEILDAMNKRCPFNEYNGIRVTELGKDRCTVRLELRPESMNAFGAAHGGLIYSMCDAAAGVAVCLGGRPGVTLSGSIRYLCPSKGEYLRAEGEVIKSGKSIVFVETKVWDSEGTLTAVGSFEYYIVEDKV